MTSWQDLVTLGLAVLAAVFVVWRTWRTVRGRPGIGCGTCLRCPGWRPGATARSPGGAETRLDKPTEAPLGVCDHRDSRP